jgi:hypothetical protein
MSSKKVKRKKNLLGKKKRKKSCIEPITDLKGLQTNFTPLATENAGENKTVSNIKKYLVAPRHIGAKDSGIIFAELPFSWTKNLKASLREAGNFTNFKPELHIFTFHEHTFRS